ncbi:formate dehydrogenase accessory sulfurtransferase FdhD [Pedobacter soli]|uniref:Sulfur carrier protein FdhD n=1 Tax=Pedobacter soli TaxID=390242 RepID=A0A1G6JRP5_9SPHI|nr:formate dehydrogenase accessory sulfurtransferase FdhD [Pedobacter soli]SDC21373.1 FdhD protein [Pedobacter soli]
MKALSDVSLQTAPQSFNAGNVAIKKMSDGISYEHHDMLAIEEPLEIRLSGNKKGEQVISSISVTMRTPGNDEELAKGFLFTEGIIGHDTTLQKTETFVCSEGRENIITLALTSGQIPDLSGSERNFYTTSSCGVCGKSSIASIRTRQPFQLATTDQGCIDSDVLLQLPAIMQSQQDLFSATGGLHACGLFNTHGALLDLKEDVGRHNALDKLIGKAFTAGLLPLRDHVLLLSGRASFELVQKAAMAGIATIAAIGAPSSLAVELASECNITLVGFLRGRSFNIYTGAERIKSYRHENKN